MGAGQTTQLSGTLVHTCAEDSRFRGVGDMIFDSAYGTTKTHGIPKLPHGWKPYTQLMSDHLPVYAVKEFHSVGPHGVQKKRKLDAEDSNERRLPLRSPSFDLSEIALWDDVDKHAHETGSDVCSGPLCCKRARRN